MKKRRFSGNLNGKTHFKVTINVRYFRQATMNEIECATTKRRNGKRNFAIQKHQGFPQEKATATAWRISEDFAKRVSAKPRSAPCRLLRNWVCFYAKTCRSLARAYACALVSKTTARLTGKLESLSYLLLNATANHLDF